MVTHDSEEREQVGAGARINGCVSFLTPAAGVSAASLVGVTIGVAPPRVRPRRDDDLFALLGPLRISGGTVRVRSARDRIVLAMLLLQAGHTAATSTAFRPAATPPTTPTGRAGHLNPTPQFTPSEGSS